MLGRSRPISSNGDSCKYLCYSYQPNTALYGLWAIDVIDGMLEFKKVYC